MDIFEQKIQEINNVPLHVSKGMAIGIIHSIKASLATEGRITIRKYMHVETVQKYDLLSVRVGGIEHPSLVYRVTGDTVHVVTLSSTEGTHNICELTGSRLYGTSYMTNTMFTLPMSVAINCFVSVYDSRTAANRGFRHLRAYFKSLFRL